MRAWLALRKQVHYRRDAFAAGITALGYKLYEGQPPRDPKPDDIFICWNRYGSSDVYARWFEAVGAKVIVTENGYLGKDWLGDIWYAMSLSHHNGAGRWPKGDDARWDNLGLTLPPMREDGDELVMLPQRGIGEPGVAMPRDWLQGAYAYLTAQSFQVRVRQHPGMDTSGPTLEEDLAHASAAVTWGSGAALKALSLGVPVFYDFSQWIGGEAGTPLGMTLDRTDRRLGMFRRMIHAQYRLGEIASGEAIQRVLCAS